MKFSEAWLREWVNPDIDTSTLCQQLTMAGLEVGSVENAAPNFESVVVSEVISVDNHPDADKLSVCKVNDGNETLQIVCGAKNVRPGLKVPLIKVGGFLTNPEGKQFKIKKSKLRGVESNGMLCSAVELGLAESSEGLYELPNDAPVGKNIREYLQLDDKIIEVDLTPNRGDCLSLRGIAREVATLNHVEFNDLCFSDVVAAKIAHEDIMPITLQAAEHCKAFSGRIVKNINASATTPIWMQEKLRRSGIRPIHPVVDISNFVMLESGQPTHTFDLNVVDSEIQVRFAKPGEKLTLLDGKEVILQDDVLVVADKSKALAMGGIMGGEHSGISDDTKDVFIECAHFAPLAIAGKARCFGLHTDASHRFERGVDPALLITVVERITQLLLEIVGGEAGPIEYVGDKFNQRDSVSVSHQRIENLLGIELSTEFVLDALNRLDIQTSVAEKNYQATIPTHRFDLSIPEDLIEEVGRIHGLSSIQSMPLRSDARLALIRESTLKPKSIKRALVARGYHEVISYSFISEEQHRRYAGSDLPLRLKNPISTELAIMRESLVPSLIATLTYN
ncbi:MAG: phenylalanine--tRNA ligase subunit beta, partial [Gammaproteobacteria bacterium]|nr:phenylalanine--tRNA ligase subunit beta [Gammaproteobacteria bacterium]